MKQLIFDTSAINGLAADSDATAIVRALGVGFKVGLTATALGEVVATSDERVRNDLLDLMKRLLSCGECLMAFNWIIEGQAKAYQRDPSAYNWRSLVIRFREAEKEIARQEYIHILSEQTKEDNRRAEKTFKAIFTTARPHFDEIFDGGKNRPSLQEVTKVLVVPKGAYFEIAADLFERATGKRPSSDELTDFVERCPPFKALIMALCFTQYNICIRGENIESLGDAGRVDIFSAVFLPYCDLFVTKDEGQRDALRVVAGLAGVETSIELYKDFKHNLFGIG